MRWKKHWPALPRHEDRCTFQRTGGRIRLVEHRAGRDSGRSARRPEDIGQYGFDSTRDHRPGELSRASRAGVSHPSGEDGVHEQTRERIADGARIRRIHKEACFAVDDRVDCAANVSGHHRESMCGGLKIHDAEAFPSLGWRQATRHGEDVRTVEPCVALGIRQGPQEADVLPKPQAGGLRL